MTERPDDPGRLPARTMALVGVLAGMVSGLLALSATGWTLRGWIDDLAEVAERVEQVDAAAVTRDREAMAARAELRAEMAALEAEVRAHLREGEVRWRSDDRRLTLLEERQRFVFDTLRHIIEASGVRTRPPPAWQPPASPPETPESP